LWRPESTCAREESYAELFPLLGDEPAQDEVRAADQDLRHCGLLARDPSACFACELDENPYPRGQAREVLVYLQNQEPVAHALDLELDRETGLIGERELLQLSPEEYDAMAQVREHKRRVIAEFQARLIGAQLAALLAGSGSDRSN
jgi:hypothetical protein